MTDVKVFGSGARAMRVVCSDEAVSIEGLWWTKRNIPTDRIVAMIPSAVIVYCGPRGRIRRRTVGFLRPGRFGDPSYDQRRQLEGWISQAVHSAIRDDKRKLDHLDDGKIEDRLRTARAAQRWAVRRAAKHPLADLYDVERVWARHVATLEAELARRRLNEN